MGTTDGIGTVVPKFSRPAGLCIEELINIIYVCDLASNSIRRVSLTGEVTTIAQGKPS